MKLFSWFKIISFIIILGINFNLSAAEMNKQLSLDINSSKKLFYIQNLAGNIEIMQSSDDQIRIRGQVNASAETIELAKELISSVRLDTQQTRNQTIISVAYPVDFYEGFIYKPNKRQDSWRIYNQAFNYMSKKVKLSNQFNQKTKSWANVHTDLTIELPKNQWNKVNNIAGDIRANNLNGESTISVDKGNVLIAHSKGILKIHSSQGPVNIKNHTGKLDVKTVYGDITGDNISGNIDVKAQNGNIKINKQNGDIRAKSGFGPVTINRLINSESINLTADNGDLRLNGNLLNTNNISLISTNGNIDIVSTHTPSLKFDIETSGEININSPERVIQKNSGDKLVATIGNAKGKASIESDKGNVNFSISKDLNSVIKMYADTDHAKEVKRKKISKDSKLAAMVRIALNRSQKFPKANFSISANDGIVAAKGNLNSKAEIVTAMQIILSVKGVEEASVSSNNKNLN